MSYVSTVLSFPTVAFWYLDQLDTGDGMVDLSPEGADGIFRTGVVLGLASPIETDADSRSAGPLVGYYYDAAISGSPQDVRDAFTLNGWTYNDGVIWNKTILSRVGAPAFGGYVGIDITTGNRAHASISFSEEEGYELTSPEEIPADTFAMISVTRFANVMLLYINARLVAQRFDLPTGPLEWANYNEGGWKVGFGIGSASTSTGAAGNVWQATRTCAVSIHPLNLSADDLLLIYESALLNPPLSLRADLHFNCTLEIDDEPTPSLFPFRPDWSSPIRETLGWLTDIRTSKNGYEQRAAVRQRPRRTLEFQTLCLDNTERRRFRAYLRANQKRTIYLPIFTDESLLASDAAAGAAELDFPTEFLDFNDGAKLALYEDQDNQEVVAIDTVGDETTTLAGETAQDHTANVTSAIPVVRALIAPEVEIVRLTDAMEEAPINFRIFAEDIPLTPHRLGSYSPRYTVDDIQVFDPFVLGPANWEENGKGSVTVRAADPESAAGIFSRLSSEPASREITSYTFALFGREEIATFLAWWYSMKGRLKPIWVPTLQEDFKPISATFGHLTVWGNEYTDFYLNEENRSDFVFVYNDGTMVFRRFEGLASGADQETLDFIGNDANTLTNLRCFSFLKLSRLLEDSIDLVWTTDQDVDVTVNFIDLLTTP